MIRAELPEGHCDVVNMQTALEKLDWYEALDGEEQKSFLEANDLQREAVQAARKGDFESALADLNDVQSQYALLNTPPCDETIVLQLSRSHLLILCSRPKEAVLAASTAQRLAIAADGELSPSVIKCLCVLNKAYIETGDMIGAARAICSACRICSAFDDEVQFEYVECLLDATSTFLKVDDLSRAQACLDKASGSLDNDGTAPPATRREALARRVLNSRAVLDMQQHKYESALQKADEYLKATTNKADRAFAQRVKGAILLKMGKTDEARDIIYEAADLTSAHVCPSLRAAESTIYAAMLTVDGRLREAMDLLENQISQVEAAAGKEHPVLDRLLRHYAKALGAAGRNEDAHSADQRAKKVKDAIQAMRATIESDKECKLPWEERPD
ncbi:MAG TPA: hypothetical protein VHD36_19080 [Pirellulales bacterium]|nr:hypothetical protein [Pirellulales bacterium]